MPFPTMTDEGFREQVLRAGLASLSPAPLSRQGIDRCRHEGETGLNWPKGQAELVARAIVEQDRAAAFLRFDARLS
jgi:hypothetical protein